MRPVGTSTSAVQVSRNGEECLLIQVAEAEAESDVAGLASSKQGLGESGAQRVFEYRPAHATEVNDGPA